MNEKIINRMTNIVADLMKSFQSDFTKYDKPYIETADESKFPMLWIVGESHTHLLRLGDYDEHFNNDEAARYTAQPTISLLHSSELSEIPRY